MIKGNNGINGGESEKNSGNSGLSSVAVSVSFIIFMWFCIGQLLMVFLLYFPLNDGVLLNFINFISNAIPSVASIEDAAVFSGEVGRRHNAILWALSVPLTIGVFCSPVDLAKFRKLTNSSDQFLMLALVFFVFSILSVFADYYTGFYTFGLNRYSFGFAIMSSVSTIALPLAARYLRIHRKIIASYGVNNNA